MPAIPPVTPMCPPTGTAACPWGRFLDFRCEQVINLCSRFAGAFWQAAETYNEQLGAQFHSYAISVIHNHLLDYCRKIQSRAAPVVSLEAGDMEMARSGTAGWDGESSLFVEQVLEYGKRTYSGVARLGVEALELKIAGYSGTDIAKLYGVQPNHVGAWISRAAQKLKKDLFLVENGSTNP